MAMPKFKDLSQTASEIMRTLKNLLRQEMHSLSPEMLTKVTSCIICVHDHVSICNNETESLT